MTHLTSTYQSALEGYAGGYGTVTVIVPTVTTLPPDCATTVMGNVTDVAPAGVFGEPMAVLFVPTDCLLTAPSQDTMAAARAKIVVAAAIVRATTWPKGTRLRHGDADRL